MDKPHKKCTSSHLKSWLSKLTLFHGLKDDEWNIHRVRDFDGGFCNNPNGYSITENSSWRCINFKWNGFFDEMNAPVFIPSAVLIVIFVLVFAIKPEWGNVYIMPAKDWVSFHFGWFYVFTSTMMLFIMAWMCCTRIGDIRLGRDDQPPKFRYFTWVSMLFSAGVGIGLVFYGMAQPLSTYKGPPNDYYGDMENKERAIPFTIYCWGIHGWAGYAIIGLSLSYYTSRLGIPMSLRSSLYPYLGKYTLGWPGHAVDIISICGTLCGLAASLGLGALQINSGVHATFDAIPISFASQSVIICITGCAACISVMTGLAGGLKWLSLVNMFLCALLMLFIFFINDPDSGYVGGSLQMMDSVIEHTGMYIRLCVGFTLKTGAYNVEEMVWMKDWTVYYFGYFFSWCPFVALFLANISEGRTIREYIIGVILTPTVVCIVWFTIFGQFALNAAAEKPDLFDAEAQDLVFEVYQYYVDCGLISNSTKMFLSIITVIVLLVFFVTTSDSGSYVVDVMGNGGSTNPPKWQKIWWAMCQTGIALVLLYSGGSSALSSIQACVILVGLPLAVIWVFVSFGLVKTLLQDPYILQVDAIAHEYRHHVNFEDIKIANNKLQRRIGEARGIERAKENYKGIRQVSSRSS